MDTIKNCGVCTKSSLATGEFCEDPVVIAAATIHPVTVGIARSASMSACGPEAKRFDECKCLEQFCVRHGQDKRR